MNILFVGQSPSKANYNSDITLPGTTGFRKLLEWVDSAGLSYFDCQFINACHTADAKEPSPADIELLRATVLKTMPGTKIVAVGKVAAWALRSAGILEYLEFPSPTASHNILSNELFIRSKIKELRKYVNPNMF